MGEAEQAVKGAVADIPAELLARLETADSLSDEERQALVNHARRALNGLDLKQGPEQAPTPGPGPAYAPGGREEP
jgi:F-type H+-transporting ATPase subunit alpha